MNGSLDTADVLLNRGLNGGYGGYGIQGREFASDATNAVRIKANQLLTSQGQNAISEKIDDNADRNRDTLRTLQSNTQFDRVNDKISDQSDYFTNAISRVSEANAVSHNEIIREMNANAREQAKCCCEAKVLAVENQAKTDAGLAQVLANQVCDTRVADAVANATQNAKLDAILASGHGNGRGLSS